MLSVTYRLRPKKHLRNKTQQLNIINSNWLLTLRGLLQDNNRPKAAEVLFCGCFLSRCTACSHTSHFCALLCIQARNSFFQLIPNSYTTRCFFAW